ncbi:MAG: hypothetical protein WBN59_08615, partial [Flavobacteriaceae bacterium]
MKAFVSHKGNTLLIVLLWALFMAGCRDRTTGQTTASETTSTITAKNLLLDISKDNLGDLDWINTPGNIE